MSDEVRIVEAPSELALFDLLSSLNDAGERPELACLVGGAPIIAGLWDVDYAGTVHYLTPDGDTGQVPCVECTPLALDWKPAFPLTVVLAYDPDPIEDLFGEVGAWWR